MGKIILEDLEFYAYHGLFEEEQKVGGKYIVNLELDTDFSEAATSDNIEGTIDYSEVYSVISKEMEKKSKLIEHVAGRIVTMLFVSFKQIEHIMIKLTKVKPPIDGNVQKVSVIIDKSRTL